MHEQEEMCESQHRCMSLFSGDTTLETDVWRDDHFSPKAGTVYGILIGI